jgi:hypothetical protein
MNQNGFSAWKWRSETRNSSDFKTKFKDFRIFLQNRDLISKRHNFICVSSKLNLSIYTELLFPLLIIRLSRILKQKKIFVKQYKQKFI